MPVSVVRSAVSPTYTIAPAPSITAHITLVSVKGPGVDDRRRLDRTSFASLLLDPEPGYPARVGGRYLDIETGLFDDWRLCPDSDLIAVSVSGSLCKALNPRSAISLHCDDRSGNRLPGPPRQPKPAKTKNPGRSIGILFGLSRLRILGLRIPPEHKRSLRFDLPRPAVQWAAKGGA